MRRALKSYNAIGLMSGTSLDGLDGVLIRARPKLGRYDVDILAHQMRPYPVSWVNVIKDIAKKDSLRSAHLFASLWSELSADLCKSLCEKANLRPSRIHCIGAHGQTVAHMPKPKTFLRRKLATTIQLVDISRLALKTGTLAVGNFRAMDIAGGGEGAPLAPHAHRLLFAQKNRRLGVLNLGGMSNLSVLRGSDIEMAFDLGPGNVWMDYAVRKKTRGKMRFDRNGKLARQGNPNPRLMKRLLKHPYLKKAPPKSCGWEEFGDGYLSKFDRDFDKLSRNDAIATVTHATSWAIAQQIHERISTPRNRLREVIVAGGGAKNSFLMELISERLPMIPFKSSLSYGIGVTELEPLSFALFALETLRGRPITESKATGAEEIGLSGEVAFGDGKGLF